MNNEFIYYCVISKKLCVMSTMFVRFLVLMARDSDTRKFAYPDDFNKNTSVRIYGARLYIHMISVHVKFVNDHDCYTLFPS